MSVCPTIVTTQPSIDDLVLFIHPHCYATLLNIVRQIIEILNLSVKQINLPQVHEKNLQDHLREL